MGISINSGTRTALSHIGRWRKNNLIQKGFKIIEVGNEEKFDEGDMRKAERDAAHIILRSCTQGKSTSTALTKNGIAYKAIAVENKTYIPDTTIMV